MEEMLVVLMTVLSVKRIYKYISFKFLFVFNVVHYVYFLLMMLNVILGWWQAIESKRD